MAITLAWSSCVAQNNGKSIVAVIPPSSVQTDDVILLFGAKSGRAAGTVGPPVGLGYTSVYTTSSVAQGPNLWVGFKIVGATPDSSLVSLGSENIQDVTLGIAYVLRGVSSTVSDFPIQVAPWSVLGTGGDPNPPSVITATNQAWVVATGLSASNNTAVASCFGYTNLLRPTQNDTRPACMKSNTREIAVAGTEDPGLMEGWNTATSTISFSWAIQPFTATAPNNFHSYAGTYSYAPKQVSGYRV